MAGKAAPLQQAPASKWQQAWLSHSAWRIAAMLDERFRRGGELEGEVEVYEGQ